MSAAATGSCGCACARSTGTGDRAAAATGSSSAAPQTEPALPEVARARVDVGGIGEHVHERRTGGGECAVERGSDLVRLSDELAVPAERGHHLVVARSGAELGHDVVAVDHVHRVLL